MRLPTYTDLSKEQDQVYLEAPLTGAILVSGPPGSGKTVMAFYRADTVARKGQQPTVLMFNHALERYTRSATKELKNLGSGRTSTFFQWLSTWWKRNFGKWVPQVAEFVPDWDGMERRVLMLDKAGLGRIVRSVGHLIVDEGQDFAPGFYSLMNSVLAASDGDGSVSLAVFADENQRITEGRNSTLADIAVKLGVPPNHHYRLTRNYRNTKQIAAVAASFYAGLPGGVPKLPERSGPQPKVTRTESVDYAVGVVERFIRANEDLETVVFLPTTKLRDSFYTKLRFRIERAKLGIRIQKYSSASDKLIFDEEGTVTIVCSQSAKGLEFDAVFIPEMQHYRCDAGNEQSTKMMLYVLASRARQHLHFLYSASLPGEVPAVGYLLKNESLLEWSDGKK